MISFQIFPDPHRYKPERFIDETTGELRKIAGMAAVFLFAAANFSFAEFCPFGLGKRQVCLMGLCIPHF